MTILMHHHIFKNAGTTIDWILHRNFPGRVLHIEGDRPGARLTPDQIIGAARPHPNHQAITSHTCPLPDCESLWAQFHFTMLRDPIDRLYSMYRFERRRPEDGPMIQAAKERSFRGYCERWLEKPDPLIGNWQTRCCTPQKPLSDGHESRGRNRWDADLDAARSVISTSVFVGTVEEFDESVLLLEANMREQGISFDAAYLRKNSTPRESGEEENTRVRAIELLGESLHDRVMGLNAMDYELVELARRNIREQLPSLGDAEQKLEEFRKRCRALANSPEAQNIHVPGSDEWMRVS